MIYAVSRDEALTAVKTRQLRFTTVFDCQISDGSWWVVTWVGDVRNMDDVYSDRCHIYDRTGRTMYITFSGDKY